MEPTATEYAQITIEIIIFLIGVTGNSLVLFILHGKLTEKTVHRLFVTNLAVADLVLLCFDSPVTILKQFDIEIESGTYNCRVHLPVVTTGYNAAIFTVTSMAIHRCHMVTNPWKAKLKRSGALLWLMMIWLGAFTLVVPLIIVNQPKQLTGCKEVWPSLRHRQAYTASLMTFQYFLPLFITAVCYLRIWLFLRRQPVVPRHSGLNAGNHLRERETGRESVEIIKTVAAIVLLFVILLLPTQVAWMLLDFKGVSYKGLWFASDILTRLHSSLNPVVYGVMNRQYRRRFICYLTSLLCCRPSNNLDLEQPQRMEKSAGSKTVENTCQGLHASRYTQSSVDSRFQECNVVLQQLRPI